MKVELKQIIDQLTEAIELPNGYKVSALLDEKDLIVGWNVVRVYDDGIIEPISKAKYGNIKELIEESPDIMPLVQP